jgi:hypothetical protein
MHFITVRSAFQSFNVFMTFPLVHILTTKPQCLYSIDVTSFHNDHKTQTEVRNSSIQSNKAAAQIKPLSENNERFILASPDLKMAVLWDVTWCSLKRRWAPTGPHGADNAADGQLSTLRCKNLKYHEIIRYPLVNQFITKFQVSLYVPEEFRPPKGACQHSESCH